MPSRKLEDLHPTLQPIVGKFLERCEAAGLNILITCTYRSSAEQDALYAQGRTKPGAKVTHARGGQSRHNDTLDGKPASTAFDIVPPGPRRQGHLGREAHALENGRRDWPGTRPDLGRGVALPAGFAALRAEEVT